jgi:hypothetical protein
MLHLRAPRGLLCAMLLAGVLCAPRALHAQAAAAADDHL